MIYKRDKYDELPDAFQVRSLLKKIQDITPVKHLMPTERVVDGEDKYLLTHLANGRFVIKPNITKQGVLYYGNYNGDKFKEKFISKYYTTQTEFKEIHDELMYNNVRLEQFKLLVETFPLFDLLNKGIEIPELKFKFSLGNPYGLASIYGLPSPLVNLTSSMDVALFYATNKYDESTNRFEPIKEEDAKEGIVYIYRIQQPLGQTPSLSTLGVEVFPRTFNSHTFLSHLPPAQDFNEAENVFGLTFQHRKVVSEYFSNLFKKGELLQPQNDVLYTKWKNIQSQIYEEAVDINIAKNPEDNRGDNITYLEKKIDQPITPGRPTFTKADLLRVDLLGLWKEFVDRIIPQNEEDSKILETLRLLPSSEKYSKYFDINNYYEKR